MPNEEEEQRKYCVTIKLPEVDIMIIMPMTEEHFKLATTSDQMSWVFNNGCQIVIDKNLLDNFSVEPMQ